MPSDHIGKSTYRWSLDRPRAAADRGCNAAVALDTQARIATNARRGGGRPRLPCRARRSEKNKRPELAEQARRYSRQINCFPEMDSRAPRYREDFLVNKMNMSSRVEASTYPAFNHTIRKLLSHRGTTRIYFP